MDIFLPQSLVFMASGIFCLLLLLILLGYRDSPGIARAMGAVAAGAWINFCMVAIVISSQPPVIRFWYNLVHAGSLVLIYFWALFVMEYTGFKSRGVGRLFWRWRGLLLIPTIGISIAAFTNPYNLYRKKVELVERFGNWISQVEFGPLFELQAIYSIAISALTTSLLLHHGFTRGPTARPYIFLVPVIIGIPLMMALIEDMSSPGMPVNFSSIGITIGSAFLLIGLLQSDPSHTLRLAWQSVFKNLDIGIAVIRPDGSLNDFNEACAKLLDLSDQDKGQIASEVLSCLPASGIAPGDNKPTQYLHRDKYIELEFAPLQDQRGEVLSNLLIVKDITQLETANREKEKLLAILGHEIRGPLNILLGSAYLLEDEQQTHEQQLANLAHIKSAGEVLLQHIDQLLAFARPSAQQTLSELKVMNLSELCREVLRWFEIQNQDKALTFDFQESANFPPALKLDPVKCRQILINLIENAVKFTSKGAIGISLTHTPKSDGWHEIRADVTDQGPGISPEDIDQIFDPFVQLQHPGNQAEGVGLGLAISHQLAQAMNGSLEIDRDWSSGSRFILKLLLQEA